MKLAIDVREACHNNRAGKGQWTYGFVTELLTRGHSLLLLTDSPIPSEWEKFSPVVRIFPSGILWHFRVARLLQKRKEVDAYVSPTSFIVPFIVGKSLSYIPVVHDLIAFRKEPHNKKAALVEKITIRKALRNATRILTVSNSTKNDICDRFSFLHSDIITPIFAGPMQSKSPVSGDRDSTIICIATLSPRKNQFRLIQAFSQLPESVRTQHKLVLAGGRGWNDDSIVKLADETPGVEWIGFVNEEQYIELLSSCAALALPSLYEGFGMQIVDALQQGVPVLTSDRGSLPEVTGSCAVLVDPENIESITAGLEKILTDVHLRARLQGEGPKQAEKFSWKRTVDLFLTALNGLQ
jgi:glycosyltransferase involved in cell wall biosynthesis